MNRVQEVAMSDLVRNMTIEVKLTGVRVWWVRQRLGLSLIRAAAFVMGVGFHVDLRNEIDRTSAQT